VSRTRIGLIFGGRSVEHEVSLVSAKAVLNHLDPSLYEVIPIAVSRQGEWLTSGDARALLDAPAGTLTHTRGAVRAALTADPSAGGLVPLGSPGRSVPVDVIFPLIHGTGGEDGSLQGLLELAGLPYVGSGVLGSSLGMDKAAMKVMFQAAGLAIAGHLVVSRRRIERDMTGIAKEVDSRIGYPCFTKPSNGGSSVGVCKVKKPEALAQALAESATYDRRVLIEEGVEGQEIECAVLGNDDPQASVVGEIVPCHEFYDYSAKYLDDRSELIIPARISPAQTAQVRAMSVAAFTAVDCAGMARVDFFVRRSDGAVLINEVNTIPGFTPISMYPRLWQASGLEFGPLVQRLIELALERHEEKRANRTEFAPTEAHKEEGC